MTYIFDSTPEQIMAAFLDSLPDARGDTPGAQAEFRWTMAQLAGLHQAEALFGPVDPAIMERFREESALAMLPFGPSISFLVNEAIILADNANDDEWPGLCLDRSVIQFLIDDYAGTPIPTLIDRSDLAKLDRRLRSVGNRQGPLPPQEVLRGMPPSHWWWHYPEGEASADPPSPAESQRDGGEPDETPAARGTLVLDPQCRFDSLREGLAELDWQVVDLSHQPIVPGEPEHALFERDGRHLAYSFNPVCRLRLIEVPLDLDNETVARLPVQDVQDVTPWLGSDDERIQLRGILAAAHLPHPQLLTGVEQLLSHPRASIAQAAQQSAESIRSVLAADDRSRATALAAIEVLKQELTPLILALASVQGHELVAALRPQPADYARAFHPEIAEQARTIYEALWVDPPRVQSMPADSQLKLAIAPAGMLLEENELSRQFPGGYRALAPLLNPHRVWVAWKLIPPGKDAGMAYDGLVWLEDHWAWFPKPYRALADLIRSGAS